MGIYIPDMEMPVKGNIGINIFATGLVVSRYTGNVLPNRAVQVSPHGRLGDLDKLQKQIDIARNYGMIGKTAHYKLQKLIKEAPTIIPTEESKT